MLPDTYWLVAEYLSVSSVCGCPIRPHFVLQRFFANSKGYEAIVDIFSILGILSNLAQFPIKDTSRFAYFGEFSSQTSYVLILIRKNL